MTNEKRAYVTADDVADIMGVSKSFGYKIIKQLNNELKKDGFITVSGKVPKAYFEKRCFGYEA